MAYRINPITCKLDYYEATNNNSDLLIKIGLLMDINNQILNELKIMNLHLQIVTDEEIKEKEVIE